MSEDVKPYGAAENPVAARAKEFSALMADLHKSQREMAELLEIDARSVRRYLTGDQVPPAIVIYACRYFVAVRRRVLSADPDLTLRIARGYYGEVHGDLAEACGLDPDTGRRVADGDELERERKGNR